MIPAVRLASHEIEDKAKARFHEFRLKRLNQVREQASQFAKNIRHARAGKREEVIQSMEVELKSKLDSAKAAMVQEMEEEVLTCLTKFGGAHAKADQENEENYEGVRQQEFLKNRKKAAHLGKDALKELKIQKQQTCVEQNKKLLLRKQALDTEAVRSAYIASLPPVKVVKETVKEDPPKVIRFDKSTLFQTEYVIKDKVVEVVKSPKDARKAAILSELENMELTRKMEEKKIENNKKIMKRGREALVKEKSHSNYLRLLEQLDKLEKEPDNNWDVESTVTTEQSSLSTTRAPSPPASMTVFSSEVQKETKNSANHSTVPQIKPYIEISSTDEEDFPVRDGSSSQRAIPTPHLSERDSHQLNELGKLLKELKEEQQRFIEFDQPNVVREVQTNSGSTSTSTSSVSDGVVVFSDEDVEIRFDVTERSDSSSESQRRKQLANTLNAIRKERVQLDTILESNKPIKRPGILRKSAALPESSATSTPLADTSTKHTERIQQMEDQRKQFLKHCVQKLLEMKRQEVRELSVSSSTVTSSSTSTPKPMPGSIRSCRVAPTTPEGGEWSRRTDSSSSAYDSPAAEQSSSNSKVSNSSSLPLGAEASVYRRSEAGKWDSNGLFTLGPLLDVYNDVYQAYNQRLRVMAEERRSPQQTPPWQGSSTESSFMSLTLSATSTDRSGVSRQRVSGFPGDRSSFSVELSLSSSSSGNSSQPASVRDWEKTSVRSELCSSSSTVSEIKTSNSTGTSSQNISMPDVDEALRRLGLPSMQSVLRR